MRSWDTREPSSFASNGHSYYNNPKNWKEKQRYIEDSVAEYEIPNVKEAGRSPWGITYRGDNAQEPYYSFDLWEDEYDLDTQLDRFATWAGFLDDVPEDDIESASEITTPSDSSQFENNVDAYIQICEAHPEYYDDDITAAHVVYDGGTANFWQIGPNQWKIGIFNEDEWNPETYTYENDPYWCTEELRLDEMNDIVLTADQCYNELKQLPGVDLNDFYGLRSVIDDFPDVFR